MGQFIENVAQLTAVGKLLAHVAQEADVIGPPFRLRLANRDLDREDMPLAVAGVLDPGETHHPPFAGCVVALEIGIVPRGMRGCHQHADIVADRLGLGVAEKLLCCFAEPTDDPGIIDHDHCRGRSFEDDAQLLALRKRGNQAVLQLNVAQAKAPRKRTITAIPAVLSSIPLRPSLQP
jgi:hypothetical protein